MDRRALGQTLREKGLEEVLRQLSGLSAKKAINTLIPSLYSPDEVVRLKAVSAFGDMMKRLAGEDMEAARIVMRRLMWSLNDESGGIGWGAPEAMAEAMARHKGLLEEYGQILLSYIRQDGNYLEYAPLRKGALRGIMRISETNPDFLKKCKAIVYIKPFLVSPDPLERMYGSLIADRIGEKEDYKAPSSPAGDK
ncbi:MAG: DVU0298 family protein [Dissulfurimicrobium sp.]|uniref:DVU0298 family protein n=1 Tax=Dissulfurimicrobium TaxID=1769732 RepID=UPI001ED9FDCD|nr:DVU0298 family protein [Dissulfurimicrobium hydrothermale]UKL13897.1 HEAT repeat domain-containing protein [Dissulfurimicrobium hydrothermale]